MDVCPIGVTRAANSFLLPYKLRGIPKKKETSSWSVYETAEMDWTSFQYQLKD